ncbi:MAG: hypothetical protein RLZZ479_242, partial [Bacteroidota bacterium]
ENFYKIAGTYDNLSNFYHQGVDMNGEPMLKAQLTKEGVINNLMRNRFINVGLVRKENPLRIQGVWVNDEFHQMIQLEQ